MTNFTVSIPLKVKDDAIPSELAGTDFYVADFSLQGPRGCAFGEKLSVTFKIVKKLDELAIYTMAMAIVDGPDSKAAPQPFTFDEALLALKSVSYDATKAVEAILKKRLEAQQKAVQEAKKACAVDQQMFTIDDDEDLYSGQYD